MYHIGKCSISRSKEGSVVISTQGAVVDAVRASVLCSTSRVEDGGGC